MTVFGMLRITPITEDDITEDVAAAVEALDEHDVTYRTNAMSTVVEADTVDELLAAVGAAHKAVPGDEVETNLHIDDMRESDVDSCGKLEKVEAELGREAASRED
jgi:uncharacterized protein YqgV (UPF0045/DUF77 family)